MTERNDIKQERNDKKYSFIADFNEAYSFRMHVEFLGSVHEHGYYTFDKNHIKFIKINDKGDMVTEVTIYTNDLVNYEFNEEQPLIVGVDFEDYITKVKDIGKKDSIRMSLLKNNECFNIQLIGNETTINNDCRPIKIKKIEQLEDYSDLITDYKRPLNDQNFVTPLSSFSKICKHLGTNCTHIYLHQYLKGLKMEKIGTGKSQEPHSTIGKIEEPTIITANGFNLKINDESSNSTLIGKSKIRSKNIKDLSKLTNISSNTNVKFYFEDDVDSPIRLLYLMGCYGDIKIHMMNVN
jgi:hypothetical protein